VTHNQLTRDPRQPLCSFRHIGSPLLTVWSMVILLSIPTYAQRPQNDLKPVLNVFLLAGQSNMAGADSEVAVPPGFEQTDADRGTLFTTAPLPGGEQSRQYVPWDEVRGHESKGKLVHGPEVGFARTLHAAGWRNLAIIKVHANFGRDVQDWPWSERGSLFDAWTSFADARIAELVAKGHTVRVRGFLWHQGIDDAIHGKLASHYERNLSDLISVLRNRYADEHAPFLLARSVNSRIAQPDPNAGNDTPMAVVRRSQVNVGKSVSFAAWIDVDDLPNVNTHHFSADSQLVIGKRFGEALLKTIQVKLSEPVVVAQSPPELNRAGGGWGRWQFPFLRRLADGRLHVSFSVEPDAASSYGKPVAHAYSADEGETWQIGPPLVEHEAADGVLLPNGDRLQPVQRPSRTAAELDLPKSVCDFVCSFRFPRSLYRADELPAELSEWRFRRLPAGKMEWVEEVATMRIPDQLRSVIQEDARGATPGVGGIEQVTSGVLPTPFLWGKMRVAPDESLWAVTYDWRLQDGKPQYAPQFLRSIDQGRSWDVLGEIHYQGDEQVDSKAAKRDGFTEPDYNFRPDDSIICVMRTSDGHGHGPLYLTRSVDGAKTWSRPVAFDRSFDGGKMPQLLTLAGGVTLVSYGQSGGPRHIAVRATADPAGLDWQPPVQAGFSPPSAGAWNSCGHTEMVALDDQTALMVYSDFSYPDKNGVQRKSILTRRIQVVVTNP